MLLSLKFAGKGKLKLIKLPGNWCLIKSCEQTNDSLDINLLQEKSQSLNSLPDKIILTGYYTVINHKHKLSKSDKPQRSYRPNTHQYYTTNNPSLSFAYENHGNLINYPLLSKNCL